MVLLSGFAAYGQQCKGLQEGIFQPQNKKVRLVKRLSDTSGSYKIIFFRTSLRVNTDGAPVSYHPQDLRGSQKAINNICNGIAVYKAGSTTPLECPAAREIFAQFRDNNWKVPAGYKIEWQSVIASRVENGRTIPCIFQSGEFKGYFGSLTSLKNDLSGAAAGECGSLNQLDQRVIPAFVIPRGQNVLRDFGAGVGDLLLAYNPRNGNASAAIIGDVGPPKKLGEGSVGLNMTLLGKTSQPVTYSEALQLDTGNDQMLIAIIPRSKTYNLRKPYTKENIIERVEGWIRQAGFADQAEFVNFMKDCNQ